MHINNVTVLQHSLVDDMKKPSKDLKSSKLHKALNEFDQKL